MRNILVIIIALVGLTANAQITTVDYKDRMVLRHTLENSESQLLGIDSNNEIVRVSEEYNKQIGVAKIVFDFDENTSSFNPITDFEIKLNTLGVTANPSGDIRLPSEGIFEIAIDSKNSSFPQGNGSLISSVSFAGNSTRVITDSNLKYGGYSATIVESLDADNLLTVSIQKTTPVSNIGGQITLTIKQIQ